MWHVGYQNSHGLDSKEPPMYGTTRFQTDTNFNWSIWSPRARTREREDLEAQRNECYWTGAIGMGVKIVFDPKKYGSFRSWIYYIRLNAIEIRDSYPIPRWTNESITWETEWSSMLQKLKAVIVKWILNNGTVERPNLILIKVYKG